jgi:tRNA/tmRNA/rRNA uracil-C5-methylase (TrmA/RlmC/RlmD family)
MQPGDRLTLRIEKAVAGGRMLARHEGAIVLVAAAIPGETVEVAVEKVQRRTAWAVTTAVVDPSPDRVDPFCEWACGGSVYAHVRYERQLELKRDVLHDAFMRIGRLPLDKATRVTGSRPEGYRMRARLHVQRGRLGFYREGTHSWCDPAPTRQLLPATIDAIAGLERALREVPHVEVSEVLIAENCAGTERAFHLELQRDTDPSRLASLMSLEGVTGVSCSAGQQRRALTLAGNPEVTDTVIGVPLTRHARAFFQGNRFLVHDLATRVCALVPPGRVLDLYAGVGLFAATLAARADRDVTAVEGDTAAAEHLKRNLAPYAPHARARHQPVEVFLSNAHSDGVPHTVVVDPPRTGLSKDALAGVLTLAPERVVYVSCDVATLARDVKTFVERGYRLAALEAFDMFPHTAHIESVALLTHPPQ